MVGAQKFGYPFTSPGQGVAMAIDGGGAAGALFRHDKTKTTIAAETAGIDHR